MDEAIQLPGRSAAQMYVGYGLDEMIRTLWKGEVLPDYRWHTKQLRDLFEADRNLPKKARLSLRRNFSEAVKRRLQLYVRFRQSCETCIANREMASVLANLSEGIAV